MKKSFLLAFQLASLSAYALPTYEPFTEFNQLVVTTGSNLVAGVGGVPLPIGNLTPVTYTNASNPGLVGTSAGPGGVVGGVDLAKGGLTAPTGEAWTSLNFNGLNNGGGTTGAYNGDEVALITNSSVFSSAALSYLLPTNFPGFPAPGKAITTVVENPAQQMIYQLNSTTYITNGSVIQTNYNYAYAESANIVGNSPVLRFSQDVSRPTNGTKTIYVSYLLSVAQQGQLGGGNDGRYLGFLCQSNLVQGIGSGSSNYQYWYQMFNTFSATGPKYAAHGLIQKTANSQYYIGPCDSSAGKDFTTSTFYTNFAAPIFVVGAYEFVAGSAADTNALWMNPATNSFGGAAPPTSPVQIDTVASAYKMPDIAGLVLIDRVGNGASGGVGTNYIANLLIGTTWSYVTGGPEFTNQPANANIFGFGATVSLSGAAVAAAQSVSYQWQHVVGSATNNLTDGVGMAGGGATVSGSVSNTLTLAGVTAGDVTGTYQLVATANGTSYTLASQPASIVYHTDPFISSNPGNAATNYGGKATFTATASTSQATLSYQWYLGSTPLANGVQPDGSTVSGATGTVSGPSLSTTLTASNVTFLEAGNYSVLVTNNVNFAVQSSPGTLAVTDPIIVIQPNPIPTVIAQGGTGSVSLGAAGTGLTYQWYGLTLGQLSNGGDFFGTTNATLTIANAQLSDADTFYCVVGGSSGQTVTSANVSVYVENTAVGPFSQTSDWPPCVELNANNSVDYAIWDSSATFSFPSSWNNVLTVPASGGDQTWTTTTLGGEFGYQFTGTYFNIADPKWQKYTNVPVIDILLNVYGNSSMYAANGGGLPITYSYGNVAIATYIHSISFPQGANNSQWNWLLLTVTNVIDVNGYRTIGDPTYGTGGYGGINSGTIRLEGFSAPGLIVRAVAMGPHGVFGTTNQINRFAAPAACSPEPTNNLAWIDFNQNTSNNLSVLNNPSLGEYYTVQSGVGPAGDLRTAMQSSGTMEMPILNNYLGLPCNEALTMQVCLEVYDDPALAGSSFGPSQYATDYQGDLANYTGSPYTLTGSGQWLKVAFFVGPLNLNGVNTTPLTGGPLLVFNGAVPYVDRVEVGLIRTGTNALAGQIPDPSYLLNPLVTAGTNSGYYAEWYPSTGIANNVTPSPAYVTTLGGPATDQRICLQPQSISGGPASYLTWYLQNNVFGTTYQDNADVIMDLTYYDDPALAGNTLYPNAYCTLIDGNTTIISPSAPYNAPAILQGSGQWKEALFELPNVNFAVTPGAASPQYVCRYAASAPVLVSRVRYDVVRPAGPFEGVDYLQRLGLSATNASLNLTWRGTGSIGSSPAVAGAYSSLLTLTNTANNVYTVPMTNQASFFRLQFPGYPAYLSTYPPNPY